MIEKIKSLFTRYREQLLYLIFGGLTTLVDWGISVFLYAWWKQLIKEIPAMLHVADAIAWVAAVLFAYLTNRIWVFESRRYGLLPVLQELLTFAGGRVLTFLLQEAIMAVFVTWLNFDKYLFRILAAVIVIILNYFFSKLIVFRKKRLSCKVKRTGSGDVVEKKTREKR